MSRPIAVLRPEPGNRVTAAAIEGRGLRAIRLPLFDVRPVPWDLPKPDDFDALILTSANAVRHGGNLTGLLPLPVFAVGGATAEAARRAGFAVAAVGTSDATTLVEQAEATGVCRALHLAGRERTLQEGGIIARIAVAYATEPLPIADAALAGVAGSVALVQSARAAARLNTLASESLRGNIVIAAISDKAAQAAGPGWRRVAVSPAPHSDALIDLAARLAD